MSFDFASELSDERWNDFNPTIASRPTQPPLSHYACSHVPQRQCNVTCNAPPSAGLTGVKCRVGDPF